MATGNLRRSNLISPFGPGSLTTLVDGTSVIVPGIDAWYLKDGFSQPPIEATLHEPRLQQHLRVGKFVLPPAGHGKDANGVELALPVARFPQWSFCQYCKRLRESPLTQSAGVRCDGCTKSRGAHDPFTSQVPFLVVCSSGHISDFPWRQWVHASSDPSCVDGAITLKSSGTGDLSGQSVHCQKCSKWRKMRGVTEWTATANVVESTLSKLLDGSDGEFLCSGARPWLFESSSECQEHIVAVLRNASNVYFSNVESAIFVPETGSMDAELMRLMESPALEPVLNFAVSMRMPAAAAARKTLSNGQLDRWNDEEIEVAASEVFGSAPSVPDDPSALAPSIDREPEWAVLRETVHHPDLIVRKPSSERGIKGLGRRRLVPVLKETRVLTGFARLRSSSMLNLEASKSLLRRERIHGSNDWLPAYVVKGEGIYIEPDMDLFREWEVKRSVVSRANRLASRLMKSKFDSSAPIGNPRFVFLHTFAHVLINQMINSSGYSSASLRERIYAGSPGSDMAGILIYTASGDSDGTLGGLVRLGETAALSEILRETLAATAWCANDPVCMELGEHGQGPDGCNSAACHSCCLLPETACEHFNRGLDRAFVVGSFDDPSLGFFTSASRVIPKSDRIDESQQ